MRRLGILAGRVMWWCGWPLMWLFLRNSERTRLVLLNGRGEILVVKGWISSSGRWNLPGGGLRKGEKPVRGVLRETYEEVGIGLDPESLRFLGEFRSTSKGVRMRLHVFTATVGHESALRLQWYEIARARWAGMDELTAASADTDVLQALRLMAPKG